MSAETMKRTDQSRQKYKATKKPCKHN